jgi:hypothetical protein
MENMFRFLVLTIALSLVAGCTTVRPVELTTSICQLGQADDGRIVRLRAIYVTDFTESTFLVDADCPTKHLAPLLAKGRHLDKKSYKRFDDSITSDFYKEHLLCRYTVDVSGRYRWRPESPRNGSIHIDRWWSFERLAGEKCAGGQI